MSCKDAIAADYLNRCVPVAHQYLQNSQASTELWHSSQKKKQRRHDIRFTEATWDRSAKILVFWSFGNTGNKGPKNIREEALDFVTKDLQHKRYANATFICGDSTEGTKAFRVCGWYLRQERQHMRWGLLSAFPGHLKPSREPNQN